MPMMRSTLLRRQWLLVAVLSLLFGSSLVCAQSPTPYRANYKVSLGGLTLGEMQRGFSMQNNRYLLSLKTISHIPFYDYQSIEKSEGFWASSLPQSNCFTQQLDQKYNHWCSKDARIQNLIHQASPIGLPNVFDELSYQLVLQQDLIAHKQKFEYWLISSDKLKKYIFKIVGHERISTPIGLVKTTKVQRSNEGKRTTTLWLADDYEYLPIAFSQIRPNRPTLDAMIIQLIWKDKSVKL
jgi:hypothetical protein